MSRFSKKIAWLTPKLDILKANKEFLTYFETPVIRVNNLLDVISFEEQPFLEKLLEKGPEPQKFYHFKLHSNTGYYKNNVLNFIPFTKDNEQLLQVTIYDVEDLLHFNYKSISEDIRLRNALSLTDEYMFFYSDETKKITIFHYNQNQKVVLYDENIDEWKSRMIANGFIEEDSVPSFEAFVKDVKEIPNSLTAKIKCSIRSGSKTLVENLRFMGCGFDDESTTENTLFKDFNSSEDRFIGIGDKVKVGNFVSGRILTEVALSQTGGSTIINELQLDGLTHIFNKKTIEKFAQQKFSAANDQQTALIIVDLDHFKPVNDVYGHLEGDKVLVKAAKVLKEIAGDDGIVGRFGGDEFMMVVNGVGSEPVLRGFLRAILTNIHIAFEGCYGDINITCSIGCAMFPSDGASYEELFKKADFCLYRAKNKGRDRYVFYREDLHKAEYEESLKIKSSGGKVEVREMVELRYMANFLKTLLQNNEKNAVDNLFDHMLETYNLDSINIYMGSKFNHVYSRGEEIKDNSRVKTFLKPEYRDNFSQTGSWCIDFATDLKNDELASELENIDVKSSIICLFGSPSDILGAITFDRSRFQQRFAEYEHNCIEMAVSILNLNNQKLLKSLTENS